MQTQGEKEKKSSQLASLMEGWPFENFKCSIGKLLSH